MIEYGELMVDFVLMMVVCGVEWIVLILCECVLLVELLVN